MSTESFDKTFIVRDPKAIEQFLYDLEYGERPEYDLPQRQEQPSIEQAIEILKKRFAEKV